MALLHWQKLLRNWDWISNFKNKMADLYRNGVSYYRLYFSCPVCKERGYHTSPSYWTHAGCGGDIYIGSNATYYCTRCNKTLHVKNWKYRCPVHSKSNDEYESLQYGEETLAETLGTCLQFVKIVGISWLNEFLKNLQR